VLREYLDWPQARQVFQSQRERRLAGGRVEQEVVYGVTSLAHEQASAARLPGAQRQCAAGARGDPQRTAAPAPGGPPARLRRGLTPVRRQAARGRRLALPG